MYNDSSVPQPPPDKIIDRMPYEQQYNQIPTVAPYAQVQSGSPPVIIQPIYVPVSQPPKSNKSLWLILGIIGGILLLVASVCGVSIYLGVQAIHTSVNNARATNVANSPLPGDQAEGYYSYIASQNYTEAYGYTTPDVVQTKGTTRTPITQDAFIQQAQALDASEGTVNDYTVTVDPHDKTKVTVQVTRSGGQSYIVHLTFRYFVDEWAIDSLDTI